MASAPPRWITSPWTRAIALIAAVSLALGGIVAMFPEQTLGRAAELVSSGPAADADSLIEGRMPGPSTLTDSAGDVIAEFHDQRRTPLDYGDIPGDMVNAMVSIEDRRFFEHEGVDWTGIVRAAVSNLSSDDVQGASTLTQQYVKNYLAIVAATSPEEAAAATERSYARKLREITLAREVDAALTKEEILERYLNLVSFGHGAFGIEEAAKTYFGHGAADLTLPQAAMLAGMVQAPSALDPYTNPEGLTARRGAVLSAMERDGHITAVQRAEADAADLGVLDAPQVPDSGCIAAGDRGFFCDYVTTWLAEEAGVGLDTLRRGGYTIETTLDPAAQDASVAALTNSVSPEASGVAGVINLIEPGRESRRILAMASSRVYGFDDAEYQTSLVQPAVQVGHGAGSVFKTFTAAAALEAGWGVETRLSVPPTYVASGLGSSDTPGCPTGKFCVSNVGSYPSTMTLTEALAKSPNTGFIKLAEEVGNDKVVDMAVRLGLRSYAEDGTAERMKSSGSFSLGPTAINPLELSNVAATLASDGVWCAPQPVERITGPDGSLPLPGLGCKSEVSAGVARAMGQALSEDTTTGTAAAAAQYAGWTGDVAGKTGTTDSNQSAAFLGFTAGLAGSTYIFNDGPTAAPLCTGPVRQCSYGDLFGGLEPARTWLTAAAAIVDDHGGATLAPLDPKYRHGTSPDATSTVLGMDEDAARITLREMGFTVGKIIRTTSQAPSGTVISVDFDGPREAGGRVDVTVSRGTPYTAPAPTPSTTGTIPQPPAPQAPAPAPAPAPLPSIGDIIGGLFG